MCVFRGRAYNEYAYCSEACLVYPESAGAGLGARDQQAQLPPLEHRGAGLGVGVARRQPRALQHQRRHQPPGPRVGAVRRPQRQHAPRPQAEPQQARDPEAGGAGGEAAAGPHPVRQGEVQLVHGEGGAGPGAEAAAAAAEGKEEVVEPDAAADEEVDCDEHQG